MARFRYRGRGGDGQLRQGTVEAPSEEAAAGQLMEQGVTPIELRAEGGSGGGTDLDVGALLRRYLEPKVTLDDLVLFVRQLHALLHAGVPIIRALRGLAENTRNPRLARAVEAVATGLEGGQSLTEGLAQYPEVFPRLLIAMVRVGEESGRLEESLERMTSALDQERNTRKRVKQALRYPTFVMVAIVVALFIVNVFVIPSFTGLFAQFDADLPVFTVILINTSDFFVAYWPFMLVGLAGVVLGARRYVATEAGRLRWDRVKLRLPIVGKILLRALLARFARTFAMAMRSGVPLLQTLRAVADTTDNAYVARGIDGMRTGIESGESLYQVAADSQLFTPLVLQMLAVGEETGQVADMMDQVAIFYEGEVEADLDALSSSIEPIVIGIIGVMVLVLALGIFLPMLQLGAQAL